MSLTRTRIPDPAAPGPPPVDPLAPVRRALLSAAERDAARALATADTDAEATRREAETQAAAILTEARARGEADGREAVTAERGRARRLARGTVLEAQREGYTTLRREVHHAVTRWRDQPGYPALRERLAARARALVGPGATVSDRPEGGVVAEAPGRRAALTLPALADRGLDALAADLPGLWAP
ncbi:MAG: hypothetical protein ACXVW2_02755 [Nocardioidaceae bacterium]